MSVEDRVRQVVADVLGLPVDRIGLETSHQDVDGWDSLNVINMMMAIESEFAVELDADDAGRLVSVAAIVDVVRERIG